MTDPTTEEKRYTRRALLEYDLIVNGTPWWEAREAVDRLAQEHPEWCLTQEFTFPEWRATHGGELGAEA